jgi:hypothetical protein
MGYLSEIALACKHFFIQKALWMWKLQIYFMFIYTMVYKLIAEIYKMGEDGTYFKAPFFSLHKHTLQSF